MGLSHTHGVWVAVLERWDLCMLSVVYLVYLYELCAHSSREPRGEDRQHVTDTYVRNKAPRIETKEIVSSTPAGKKTLSARHVLQKARIAPRSGPMCPSGIPVSEY